MDETPREPSALTARSERGWRIYRAALDAQAAGLSERGLAAHVVWATEQRARCSTSAVAYWREREMSLRAEIARRRQDGRWEGQS